MTRVSEPVDDPYDPYKVDLTMTVTCGSKALGDRPHAEGRLRSFSFRRMKNSAGLGDWEAVRAHDEDTLAERDRRAHGGILPLPRGWQVLCSTCGNDKRFDRERLSDVLDKLAAAGVQRVALDTLAKAYAR